ncbi:MAG: hypothetical protein K6D96_00540 [Acetatifactor sp.]|nr:hypothetical protein [Acetatifactor sp.]
MDINKYLDKLEESVTLTKKDLLLGGLVVLLTGVAYGAIKASKYKDKRVSRFYADEDSDY